MKESNSNQISWEYNKGITLIALVITIIIMLILATVTIKISSQGGLFEYARKATRETTITQEREQIQEAYVYASSNSLTGEVFAEDLQSELENNLGMNKTTTIGNGGNLRVLFLKTNNLYYVNSNGEVTKAEANVGLYDDYTYVGRKVTYKGTNFVVFEEERYNITFKSNKFSNFK